MTWVDPHLRCGLQPAESKRACRKDTAQGRWTRRRDRPNEGQGALRRRRDPGWGWLEGDRPPRRGAGHGAGSDHQDAHTEVHPVQGVWRRQDSLLLRPDREGRPSPHHQCRQRAGFASL